MESRPGPIVQGSTADRGIAAAAGLALVLLAAGPAAPVGGPAERPGPPGALDVPLSG